MDVRFRDTAFAEYNEFWRTDRQIAIKIDKLITEIARTPYEGTGHPERLKYEMSGYWSRRISKEHRLVYRVDEENDVVFISSCMGHYDL